MEWHDVNNTITTTWCVQACGLNVWWITLIRNLWYKRRKRDNEGGDLSWAHPRPRIGTGFRDISRLGRIGCTVWLHTTVEGPWPHSMRLECLGHFQLGFCCTSCSWSRLRASADHEDPAGGLQQEAFPVCFLRSDSSSTRSGCSEACTRQA